MEGRDEETVSARRPPLAFLLTSEESIWCLEGKKRRQMETETDTQFLLHCFLVIWFIPFWFLCLDIVMHTPF